MVYWPTFWNPTDCTIPDVAIWNIFAKALKQTSKQQKNNKQFPAQKNMKKH